MYIFIFLDFKIATHVKVYFPHIIQISRKLEADLNILTDQK